MSLNLNVLARISGGPQTLAMGANRRPFETTALDKTPFSEPEFFLFYLRISTLIGHHGCRDCEAKSHRATFARLQGVPQPRANGILWSLARF